MATKEAYQKKWEAQLNEWDAMLAVLTAKAHKATADARIKYENELANLRKKQVDAHKTLEELVKRNESAWEDMKDGAEKVWNEMSQAMDKVAARFK